MTTTESPIWGVYNIETGKRTCDLFTNRDFAESELNRGTWGNIKWEIRAIDFKKDLVDYKIRCPFKSF